MKKLFFLLSVLVLVSCGKKATSDSVPHKNENPLVQVDLSNQEFTQATLNGESILNFYESDGGSIKVYLDSGSGYAPLKEKNYNALSANFRFNDYKYIEEDIIELTNITRISGLFVANCAACNSYDPTGQRYYRIEKSYYELLNNQETIRVKILNINGNKQFILLKLGTHLL